MYFRNYNNIKWKKISGNKWKGIVESIHLFTINKIKNEYQLYFTNIKKESFSDIIKCKELAEDIFLQWLKKLNGF